MMWFSNLLLAVTAGVLVSCATPAPVRSRDPEDVYAKDFLLGWYDTTRAGNSLTSYQRLGFNASVPYTGSASKEQTEFFMHEAYRLGIQAFMQVPSRLFKSVERTGLEDYIRTAARLPFLGWYLADEPELNRDIPMETLVYARALIREIDGRPVFVMNYHPRAMAEFGSLAEYSGINYYPAFQGTLPFMYPSESFRSRTERASAQAVAEGLDLVLAVQGYGRAPDGSDQFHRRLPSRAETRYMFWAALAARPRAIFYWARYRSDPEWIVKKLSPVMEDFRRHFPDKLGYWNPEGVESLRQVSVTGLIDGDGKRSILLVNHGFLRSRVKLGSIWSGYSILAQGSDRVRLDDKGYVGIPGHGMALISVTMGEHK